MKSQTKQVAAENGDRCSNDQGGDAGAIALGPAPQTSANSRDRQPSPAPMLVAVKALALKYGVGPATIYEFIKTEPDFPYVNVGVKKKFLIDVNKFDIWLTERTKKQKHEHFAIPTALDLTTVFKSKSSGANK